MKYFILIMAAFIALSCGGKKDIPLTAEVVKLSEENRKTITLRSVGYGNSKDESILEAEKKSFEILFFRGIPNSSMERPLLGIDRTSIESQHQQFFENFYGTGYQSFVISSFTASEPSKYKGVYSAAVDIKINIASLRRHLEDRGLIRKFGF